MPKLLDHLYENLTLGDGATGTYLYELGVPSTHCLEELNLSQPDLLTRVYQEYADAGAQILETNSFGANWVRLARYGLETRVSEINWKAARVAREALKGRPVWVGGSVGPLSLRPADGIFLLEEQKQMYRDQIGALLDGGCDLIFLETFTLLDELLLALEVFQNLTNIPVVTSLAVSEEGRLASGETLIEGVEKLRAAGSDIVGINGTCGPQACVQLLAGLTLKPDDLLSVYPNAGKPEFYEGRFNYAARPAYFADMLPLLVEQGAHLIGGDYGTRPEHIAALAGALKNLKPVRQKMGARPRVEIIPSPLVVPASISPVQELSLLDRLKIEPITIVELDSPKTLSLDKFLTGARALQKAGAAAITLADNSLAILRVSNLAAAVRLRQEIGITALLHLACRDRNLLGLQSEIMGLGTLGFRHVLALTGDPARVGDHPGATSVYDLNSLGLIKLLTGMNRGVNAVGKSLQGQTEFVIGCAFNPNALNFDSQLKKLESKIAAGAQYVLTQPVFDLPLARKTVERLRPLGLPVFLGVMPLLSSRNAEFLHNEVPGIKIAEPVREQLRQASDASAAIKIGLALAREIRQVAREGFRCDYLITPFLRYELSVELLQDKD